MSQATATPTDIEEPSELDIETQFNANTDASKTLMVSVPSWLLHNLSAPTPSDADKRMAFNLWLDNINPTIRNRVPQPAHHKMDNPDQVFFYEQDFYVLSNFSSFNLKVGGLVFPTSEHAYHYAKFNDRAILEAIRTAPSAHEAFKIAERNRAYRIADWDQVKVGIMREILHAKAAQHEYVRRKLLATGDRELIEDSWRDDYWGWGPDRQGKNMLGKLWMEVRRDLRGPHEPVRIGEHNGGPYDMKGGAA
ncbi:hypothetical protein D9M73_94220 [compost metagenome]